MTKTVPAQVFSAAVIGMAMAIQFAPVTAQVERQARHRGEAASVKLRVLFNRYQTPVMTVFIADADGQHERPLVPAGELAGSPGRQPRGDVLAYSPSFSADGRWVVFTAERDGQADIYRIQNSIQPRL